MSVIEIQVPSVGESVNEVTLSQWLKKDGEYVARDEAICEFESDKATLEFPAEASGKLIHVAKEGDDLEIGALVARIDTSVSQDSGAQDQKASTEKKDSEEKKQTDKKESREKAVEEQESEKATYAAGHPSPAAAKILKENDIEAKDVEGTGKNGRITKEDAINAVGKEKAEPASKEKESSDATNAPSRTDSSERKTERKKMSRMRRTIAKRLVSAKNETAMLTTFNEADMSGVFDLRSKYQEQFVEKFGIKLGFMSMFSKACSKVLMEMPDVNAMIDGEELVYHRYVDISIAISTPNGLVVPPVHNVESLSLAEIEWKIKELADKARKGELTIEEMTGGTFTITNGGIFGSLMSTPIINEPQSAILGMHAINERPVAINGKVEVRPMMYLALSYDHRVIDGSTSVTFLKKVKELVEDPISLLLDL